MSASEQARQVWAARLSEVEPGALLIPVALMRRVIKRHRDAGLTIPHTDAYTLDREALLEIVAPREVGVRAEALPQVVFLIAEPEAEQAEDGGIGALALIWRRLFHIKLHVALEARVDDLDNPQSAIRARIDRIGQAEFDEIRAVLDEDELLLPPVNDRSVYVEFAARFLELRRFAPALLSHSFPTLLSLERIDALLGEDVDADEIYEATRLEGAQEPSLEAEVAPLATRAEPKRVELPAQSPETARKLLDKAALASKRGNMVRSAILATRASEVDLEVQSAEALAVARVALASLGSRLGGALGDDAPSSEVWCEALWPLLRPASIGVSPVEARLLFDLQKVCVEHERVSYKLDPIGWLRSKGSEPMLRPLKGHRLVLGVLGVRSAVDRLSVTRLSSEDQARLTEVLASAVRVAESRLRERMRPVLRGALEAQVALGPRNLPEEVARAKLIEELLDRLVERGFLTMGDLRDGLSRSPLKMPDMTTLGAFFMGDELLAADLHLHRELDAAYRRGEVYLRWLQRMSALAFGTRLGRWLTLYLVLPFGGGFVILSGLQHLFNPVSKWLGGPQIEPVTPVFLLLLGVLLLGLLHHAPLRRGVWRALKGTVGFLVSAVVAAPAWLARQPWMRRLIAHPVSLALWRFGIKPLILSGLLWVALPVVGVSVVAWGPVSGALFVGANLLLNSRLGRRVEDTVAAWLATNWRFLTVRLVPGLIELVLSTFQRAMDQVERVLYTVDEWLRFKSSDGRFSRLIKAVVGLLWSVVTYVVRIYVNLLIEPQINPIKHFPVVTVSHKVILPLTLKLTAIMAVPLAFLGPVLSNAIAGATVFLLPGVFGFLVWELKENWRLYRANRPQTLQPLRVGHHGETVLTLMKPGFHSGTLPKLFGKLRRVESKGVWKAARKHQRKLHQVEHAMHTFVERELVALLAASGRLEHPIEVGEIGLGSKRIRVSLVCAGVAGGEAVLAFEEQSGWLVADLTRRGFIDSLEPTARRSVEAALDGLYKLSGVGLVRAQLRGELPPGTPYDVADRGLLVWPGDDYSTEVVYDLSQRPRLKPEPRDSGLGPIEAKALIFGEVPLSWDEWVARW